MPIVRTHDLIPGQPIQNSLQVYNGQEYAQIQLTKGRVALIDQQDYARISAFNWFACVGPYSVRAARMVRRKIQYIHHEVLEIFSWDIAAQFKEVDHIDRNTLHNWRDNLRVVSHLKNMQNSTRAVNRVGVCFNQRASLWMAYLDRPDRNRKYLGYRKTREEALALVAEARNADC